MMDHLAGRHRTIERPMGSQGSHRRRDVGPGYRSVHDCGSRRFRVVVARKRPARGRHRDGVSVPARGGIRRRRPYLSCAVAQRLPFLARPGLCHRGAHRRSARRDCGFAWTIAAIGLLTFISDLIVAALMKKSNPDDRPTSVFSPTIEKAYGMGEGLQAKAALITDCAGLRVSILAAVGACAPSR